MKRHGIHKPSRAGIALKCHRTVVLTLNGQHFTDCLLGEERCACDDWCPPEKCFFPCPRTTCVLFLGLECLDTPPINLAAAILFRPGWGTIGVCGTGERYSSSKQTKGAKCIHVQAYHGRDKPQKRQRLFYAAGLTSTGACES